MAHEAPELTPPDADARVVLELPCRYDSPAVARREMARLEPRVGHSLVARVRVVVTEMVSSCVWNASEGSVLVDVTAGADAIRGEVIAFDAEHGAQPPDPSPLRGSGFAIVLVRRLADRWGVLERRRGMWFEIDRSGDR